MAEAWTTIWQRLGLAVEVHAPRHTAAQGTIRGRPVTVSIEAKEGGAFLQEFLRGFARSGSRNLFRVFRKHTTCVIDVKHEAHHESLDLVQYHNVAKAKAAAIRNGHARLGSVLPTGTAASGGKRPQVGR